MIALDSPHTCVFQTWSVPVCADDESYKCGRDRRALAIQGDALTRLALNQSGKLKLQKNGLNDARRGA